MQQNCLNIICLTGLSNAGKSLTSNYAKEKSLKVFSLGDYIREEANSKNLEHTNQNLRKIALKYASEEKPTLINKFIEDVQNAKFEDKFIVLDGIKRSSEVERLLKHFNVILIAVLSPRSTRYNRFIKRRRTDDGSYNDFLKRDIEEIESGVGEVIALSDYFLVNESTVSEAKKRFDLIFLDINKGSFSKVMTLDEYFNYI